MSLQKLQQMIDSNKQYSYRGNKAVFKSYELVHGQIEINIEIDGHEQVFYKDNEGKLGLFLDCFKEIKTDESNSENTSKSLPAIPPTNKVPDLYEESKQQFRSLIDTLVDDIEKVRTDPTYVNQAKQVCNNVSTIVNITKLQIQLIQKN